MKLRRRKTRLTTKPRAAAARTMPALPASAGKSVKGVIREMFDLPEPTDTANTIKQELVERAILYAKRGNFFFWNKLVDLHEARLVSEDDLQDFIEKVYVTVRRHVEKLDGGKDALAEIARDLNKENE